jgi:hypothetical protein
MKPPPTDAQLANASPPRQYSGEVVYLLAFDVAYEMTRQAIGELLGRPVEQFAVDANRRSPRHLFFYRPQQVRLAPLERVGPHGPVNAQVVIKFLPVGAISIAVHVPFTVTRLEDLIVYHDLQFRQTSLHAEACRIAEETRQALQPYLIRPFPQLSEEEAYTVFCLESPLSDETGAPLAALPWLQANRRQIAALLTQEPDITRLSAQESDESTDRYLSYYEQDLVVIDWDAALILDDKSHFEETLYVMELANLQLAELEAYDRLLDNSLERAYRDLKQRSARGRTDILAELREIRVDLTRLSDELSNITKFFGDWHLARIYQSISARFHLSDWHRTIGEKLQTLDNLYQLLQHDRNNQLMLILEITIVLLFVIDLIMLFLGIGKP